MFLPYRAKNPPERFPYATIALMAMNIAVFVCTTRNGLQIRPSALHAFAISRGTHTFVRMVTSMFLHADILHIAGNMLFLWVFGPALEGRLRPLRYLVLYFAAGFAGDLAHQAFMALIGSDSWSLGASGAIMGVAGGYVLVFPYSTICVYAHRFRAWSHYGYQILEWQARWVVLLFVGFDILDQFLSRGTGGVAHMAHIGGAFVGAGLVLLYRTRRDTEQQSQAKDLCSDARDYRLLGFPELRALMESPTDDLELVKAYVEACLSRTNMHLQGAAEALGTHGQALMERGDRRWLAWALLSLPASSAPFSTLQMMRLASQLESESSNDDAIRVYRRVYETNPKAPETEMALFRMARIALTAFGDAAGARAALTELFVLFPKGELEFQAQGMLRNLNAMPPTAPTNSIIIPTPKKTPKPLTAPDPADTMR